MGIKARRIFMIVNKVGNTFGGLKFYVKSLNQSNKFLSQLEWESNSLGINIIFSQMFPPFLPLRKQLSNLNQKLLFANFMLKNLQYLSIFAT